MSTSTSPGAAAPAAGSGGSPWLQLVMATLGFALNFWAWALLSPLGPLWRDEGTLGNITEADVSLLVAIPVGAVGGFAAGLAGGLVYRGPLGDLADNVKLQVVMLGLLGLGVGLALGIPRRHVRKIAAAAIAGALGGLLAAVLYPVATSLLLPSAGTDLLIPAGTGNRVLWLGISSGVLGLVVVGMTRE